MRIFVTSTVLFFLILQIGSAQINDMYITRWNEVYLLEEDVKVEEKFNYFLDGQWLPGMISITGGKENLLQEMRYNLQLDQLEVKVNSEVYTVDPSYVEDFHIEFGINKYIFQNINLEHFGIRKTNYVQVLAFEGNYTLYKYYNFKKSKSNFNPILQTGSKSDKIKMKKALGFSDGKSFIKLPKSSKKRKRILKRYGEFKSALNDSELDVSKENDLIALFTIVNNKINTNENIK